MVGSFTVLMVGAWPPSNKRSWGMVQCRAGALQPSRCSQQHGWLATRDLRALAGLLLSAAGR